MKKRLLKISALLLAILMLSPAVGASSFDNCYWYTKRNAEHKQPECDKNLRFIEECGGIYLDKRYGDGADEKVIYLTFDVGYENGNVAKIMDVLKEEGVKASFFILGNVIDRTPELVFRMLNEGHTVCNHTVNHKRLTGASESLVREEIEGLEQKFTSLTGREMAKLFRPPEGVFDKELLQRVSALGYKTVFWSFAYADWNNDAQMSDEAALGIILSNLHNGEIMLLHPTGETNARIMKRLITELKERGYRFSTLDELK